MKNSIAGVPFGYRFDPTDAELIDVLRRVVVEKQPLTPPHDRDIHNYNMFGTKSEPSEIWVAYGGPNLLGYSQGLYFFSEIKRVTPNGSYVVRKMGGGEGKWNGKVAAVRIDGDSGPIGQKRTFGYLNKPSADNGGWLLDEYSIFAGPRSDVSNTGYDYNTVLCRLRKKDGFVVKNNNNKRKSPCDSTSSSSCSEVVDDDQTAPIKKMKRTTRGKKHEEFDVQLESQVSNNEQLEVAQESTCLSSGNADFVGSDMEHEMNNLMMVGDYQDYDPSMCLCLGDLDSIFEEQVTLPTESQEWVPGPETQQVLAPLSTDCGNTAAEEEEEWSFNLVEQLSAETGPEVVPTAPSGQIAQIHEDPFFKEFMAEVQRDQLPIISWTLADGGLEDACNPSSTFESWINSYSV